ncbi:MAG TPA: DHA2 family efflux MFS transporter permease subunit [Stellaceae bacterium]|jgi:DHA2 family multidrug resistance protein
MSDATFDRGLTAPAVPKRVNPFIVAPVAGLAAFMEILDISIANVALQNIAGGLSASQNEATWVLTSYLVANAIVLPVSGWISSLIGRKPYFILCIASFAATSLLCGLAPNLAVLTLFRAAQGVAGGGLQPTAQAILADAFPPQKRGLAFAVYGMAAVFAPAIGPALGGWITDSFNWRWVFLLNVPVGIVLTVIALRAIPDDRPAGTHRRRIDFDYLGFALLIIGMGALQIVLDRGQEDDWFSSNLITTLSVTAAACLAGFTLWELRRADPIVDLALLKHRNFAVGNLLLFVLGFTLMGSTVLVPLFVQSLLGYTATDAGLVLSPGGFAIMLLMPITGALSGKIDSRVFIGIGLVAGALALFHMTGFDATTDYSTIMLARVYQSVSLAFLFIPVNTAATVGLPMHKSDKVFAITNMTRNIGGSFGISVVTTILARRQQYHQSMLVEHVSPLNHAYNATLQSIQQSLAQHAASAGQILGLAQARLATMVSKQALALSFIDAFWFMGIVFLAATPLIFLIRPGKVRGGGMPVH